MSSFRHGSRARGLVLLLALLASAGPALALDSLALFRLASAKYQAKDWDKALAYFNQVIKKADEEGTDGARNLKALSLSLSGDIARDRGDTERALALYAQALPLAERFATPDTAASIHGKWGDILMSQGRFEASLSHRQGALKYSLESSNLETRVFAHLGLAATLMRLGVRDAALRELEAARGISQTISTVSRGGIAVDSATGQSRDAGNYSPYSHGSTLAQFGNYYALGGDEQKAVKYWDEAATLYGKLGADEDSATCLMNLTSLLIRNGRVAQAAPYVALARKAYERARDAEGLAFATSMSGYLAMVSGDYSTATREYRAAIDGLKALGNTAAVIENMKGLGIAANWSGDFAAAKVHFMAAVEAEETFRASAPAAYKREYLASIIGTYNWRTCNALDAKDPEEAYRSGELSRARLLVEQMPGGKTIASPAPKEALSRLKAGETILAYNSLSGFTKSSLALLGPGPSGSFSALALDKERLCRQAESLVSAMDLDAFFEALPGIPWEETSKLSSTRGLSVVAYKKPDEATSLGTSPPWTDRLDRIVAYYRSLLVKPAWSAADRKAYRELGALLYGFLVAPVETMLAGTKTLIIVPDGALCYLPFETLPLPGGGYLVEKFDIKYAPSLTAYALAQDRPSPPGRRPILALGGAVYDAPAYLRDMKETSDSLDAFVKATLADLEQGKSALNAYSVLGRGGISNLPGTLAEVKAIGTLVPGAVIRTGKDADEAWLKAHAASGELSSYRILHFATHGMVVPEMPELSAVLLTLGDPTKPGEDGFLRVSEIQALKLNCDLVNMSACETGLGKIFDGEGVVGLLHAFLVAGAKGVSASLWPVGDESTMLFMTSFYQKLMSGDDFCHAASETKRQFINGRIGAGKYQAAVSWAPFVYYGP